MGRKQKKRALKSITSKPQLITETDPRSPIAEQFKTLRTNIQFSSYDHALQTMVITSSSPGEGKSTVAANLAVVLAQQDKKVLIIDGDLRKPTVHYTFRIPNKTGLSSVITGQALLDDVIIASQTERVHVLPSGPVPPNPSEMLSSNRMAMLLDEVKVNYDYIVLDTPPVNAVTDAQILGKMCDGVILTLRSGVTETEEALDAKRALEATGAKILGAVLNDLAVEQSKYHYYYGAESS
ncbi:CpsD/CapB family tyrosine-protein kinase [Salisediminibacterium beveridgei]|uniref:non-specific protein-tyrosine kinase n=1 Tax=Salisediminibacterium beveridgei TaxID=632773 RepID=A0A1D7QRL4_9BACI|nr:CpsD/CapB family tyrosine-protein kinase [Salisediminibacterium beveridgei]AOM81645.1 capsular biosynthesis protein [Salisediminibacterium beveridgei]